MVYAIYYIYRAVCLNLFEIILHFWGLHLYDFYSLFQHVQACNRGCAGIIVSEVYECTSVSNHAQVTHHL